MLKRIQFLLSVAVICGLVAGLAGCDRSGTEGLEQHAELSQVAAAERHRGSFRIEPPTAGHVPTVMVERRSVERRIAPAHIVPVSPESRHRPTIRSIDGQHPIANLDDMMQTLEPHEVVAKLEELQDRRFAGAQYRFQRGSEVNLLGQRPWSVDGGLSVVDCMLSDPENPDSSRTLWIGGLELEGAPDEFATEIERERVLRVLGYDVQRVSGAWHNAYVAIARVGRDTDLGWTLRRMSRTLDAGIDEEWHDGARTWQRKLEVSSEEPSPVEFRWEDDPCPERMTLRLVLRDQVQVWELSEQNGEIKPRNAGFLQPETIGNATLVLLKVADVPEIIEPAQRLPRFRSFSQPRTAIREFELPARSLPQRELRAQPLHQLELPARPFHQR